MIPIYEVDDYVEIKNMDFFKGLTGTITEVKGDIYTIRILPSLDHSAFDIFALSNELKYISHYKEGEC